MNPDNLRQAWQTQTSETRLLIGPALLLQEVRRNQEHLAATIFWRDCREVGVALLLVPVWVYLGATLALAWTWYLTVPALLWIAGFMLADRRRHKRQPPEQGEPLRQRVEGSLAQVEHQIWLLRNIFWWYLLPPGLSILAFFAQVAWRAQAGGWLTVVTMAGLVSVVALIFAGVYWLNQYAVRTGLEPRRRELELLLASLQDETPVEG
jgi:hypothetical protein